MPDEWLEQTLQLLKDPALVAIRRRAEESPLLWHEFTMMPQPPGLSQARTWALLNALRRQTAIELASYIIDSHGRLGWYSFTHQTVHRVVYATARADLLGLVDLGFLRCSRQGRAFVFTPAPGLPQLIRKRAKASGAHVELGSVDLDQRPSVVAAGVLPVG